MDIVSFSEKCIKIVSEVLFRTAVFDTSVIYYLCLKKGREIANTIVDVKIWHAQLGASRTNIAPDVCLSINAHTEYLQWIRRLGFELRSLVLITIRTVIKNMEISHSSTCLNLLLQNYLIEWLQLNPGNAVSIIISRKQRFVWAPFCIQPWRKY